MTTNAERSRNVLQTIEFLDELAKRSDLPPYITGVLILFAEVF